MLNFEIITQQPGQSRKILEARTAARIFGLAPRADILKIRATAPSVFKMSGRRSGAPAHFS